MDEILYLEADEEITSVVDKLKGLESKSIGLVVPKGSNIAQSLVSLKLLKKEAERQKKRIAIITGDEVGQNLAAQIGLIVYSDVKSGKPISAPVDEVPENDTIEIDASKEEPVEEDLPDEFKIHRYDDEAAEEHRTEFSKQSEMDKAEATQEPKPESPKSEEKTPPPQVIKEIHSEKIIEREKPMEKEGEGFVSHAVGTTISDERLDPHHIEAERPVRYEGVPKTAKKISAKKLWLIYGLSIFAVLVIAALGFLGFEKMTVNASVAADKIEKDVDVKVEKDRQNVDLEQAIIGGTQVSKETEEKKNFNSTGQKETGEKAKGNLTFKNESGVDESIASGTTITSTGGIAFTLDSSITVPKAQLNAAGDKVLGQTNGAVTAKNSGSSSNLPASTNYIASGHSKISITGATTGGTTKIIKVVTKTDIENAKRSLLDQGKQDLSKQVVPSSEQVLLDGASNSEINDFTCDKNAGDEADSFNAKGKVKLTAILYKNEDLKQVVTSSVEKNLPAGKGLLLSDADMLSAKVKEADINVGKLTVTASLKSFVGPKIDIPGLKKSWRLRSLEKVRNSLTGFESVKVDSISLSPTYSLPIGPLLTRNMDLKLEYIQK